jgi:DNA-binding CsgD family transcriptional regulator
MLADQLVDPYVQLDDQDSTPVLEDRERKVLLGILGGLTNKKIGVNMGLSESSVKNIVQRLFGKAGVKKRSQLVRVALEGSLGTARELIRRQFKEPSVVDQSNSNRAQRQRTANLSAAKQSHG